MSGLPKQVLDVTRRHPALASVMVSAGFAAGIILGFTIVARFIFS